MFDAKVIATVLLDSPDSRETMLGLLSKTQVKAVDSVVDEIREERAAAARLAARKPLVESLSKFASPTADVEALADAVLTFAAIVAESTPPRGEEGGWQGFSFRTGVPTPHGSFKFVMTTSTKS